jgi:hypothetical protein
MAVQADNICLAGALAATNCLFHRELNVYNIIDMPPGPVKPFHLPLKDLDAKSPAISHFFDIIDDYEGHVSIDQLKPIFRDSALSELPEPFNLPELPTFRFKLQLFILPQENGNKCIIKHYYITDQAKVKGSAAKKLIRGKGHEVMWGANNKQQVKKALQYMLEQMGGFQCRIFTLTAEKKKADVVERTDDEIDIGFAHILKYGPLDKSENKQLCWIQKELNRMEGPLYKWREGLVQRALDNLANDGVLAQVCKAYPLTLLDIDDHMVSVLEKLVPSMLEKGLWMLGEPGKGKTPLGRILAMMFSRHHGGIGEFRTASDFDFFRGPKGRPEVPCLFDDGDIDQQAVKKAKAFSDVGDEETMTKERWTAAKFVQGQMRIVCDNKYDPSVEPPFRGPGLSNEISHNQFLEMVRPAFPPATTAANVMAILKRAVFLVNSKEFFYYRAAGEDERPVPRFLFDGGKNDFIKDSSKFKIGAWRKGAKALPDGYDEATLWEDNWLKEAIRKSEHGTSAKPVALDPGVVAQKIKKEQVNAFSIKMKRMSTAEPIDLDVASPKKARQVTDLDFCPVQVGNGASSSSSSAPAVAQEVAGHHFGGDEEITEEDIFGFGHQEM